MGSKSVMVLIQIAFAISLLHAVSPAEETRQVKPFSDWHSVKNVSAGFGPKWILGSGNLYSVCAISPDVSNAYLSVPYIATYSATEIKVILKYRLSDCTTVNSQCLNSVGVYAMRSDTMIPGSVDPTSYSYSFVASFSNNTKLDFLYKTEFTSSVNLGMKGRRGVYIAFRDLGICGDVIELQVKYIGCPTISGDLVKFPPSAAPNSTIGVQKINGNCVAHSVPVVSAANNFMHCYSNGTAVYFGGCHCEKGYERKGDTCAGCSAGYFKSAAGNESCQKCGNNTALTSNADSCPCKPDFYRRADKEHDSSENCHSVPRQPENVQVLHLTNTSATITWTKPSNPGTLPTIYYSVKCNNASLYCDDVTYNPTTSKFTIQSVALQNLKPFTYYEFAVYSSNDVSTGARKQYGWRVRVITKKGLSSDVTNIQGNIFGNVLTLRWNPPIFKGDATVYYEVHCDGYKNQLSYYPFLSFTVTKSGFLPCMIRVKNSVGVSRWVSKFFKLNLQDQTSATDEGLSELTTILAVAVSVIILCIVIAIVFIIRIRIKKKRENNQPPVQWNSRGRHSQNQYGFNDHNYDPVTIPPVINPEVNLGIDVEEEPLYLNIPDDKFEFSLDDLGLIKILGEGQFGIVYLATANSICGNVGVSKVAVKMLKEGARENDVRDFQLELNTMKKLRAHPHVVRLLGCCTAREPQCIILEFLANGSLLKFLRKSRGYDESSALNLHTSTLTSRQLLQFSVMIADGMQHLASQNIVHRDLACRNILVDHKFVCKISDLGLARQLDDTDVVYKRESQARLPVKWMAYESIFQGISSIKSDVWSFGVVLYEILTIGDIPYPEYKSKQVIQLIEHGYRMQKPPHCSDDLFRIMSKCWEKDPSHRPSFSGLKKSLEAMLEEDDHLYLNMDKYNDELYVHFESKDDDDDATFSIA